jgi:hypothetical protein
MEVPARKWSGGVRYISMVNTPKTTPRPALYLGRPPMDDDERLLTFCMTAFRKITGREPTPEEIEESRAEIVAAKD